MNTVFEVIQYIETELAEAYEIYDEVKGKDAQKALAAIMKASVLEQILDAIKM